MTACGWLSAVPLASHRGPRLGLWDHAALCWASTLGTCASLFVLLARGHLVQYVQLVKGPRRMRYAAE